MNFYKNTISKATKARIVDINDSVLVVGGGETDKTVFLENGFKNVVISNLTLDRAYNDFAPYQWEYQDMECLTFSNDSFDWVFVHAALHHCESPHKALCEMLRVSRKGVCAFESRDSLLNACAVKLGLVPSFELEPVALSNGKDGGLRNSHIPNYIYRWTESEVRKTANTYLPQYQHRFYFYYDYLVPTQRLSMSKSLLKRSIGKIAKLITPIFRLFLPRQGNRFAFLITKAEAIQPWLNPVGSDEFSFDSGYSKKEFATEKYEGRGKVGNAF